MTSGKLQSTNQSNVKKRSVSTKTLLSSNGSSSSSKTIASGMNSDHGDNNKANGHHHKKKSQASQRKTKEIGCEGLASLGLSSFVNIFLGLAVMCVAGYMHQQFVYQMHENTMWFTNIKEVEREISFRTEAGLYYSYFKQVVNSPSFFQGVRDLTKDNQTEHPDTINILARMNVYQEVILAGIHRAFGVQTQPIIFYIHSVFFLHGCLIAGLYTLTWLLSGSWLTALLAAVFYSFNRYDTTRVYNSISLRESFSLPFIWIQAAALTLYFKPSLSKTLQKFAVSWIFLSTFVFCVCWQFNQFIMMLQSFALFGTWILGFVPSYKIRNTVLCQLLSMLAVCALQFGNVMILSSWAVAFMLAFLAILFVWGDKPASNSFCGNVGRVVGLSGLSLIAMAAISTVIKIILNVDSDEHISKFLMNKFGIGDEKDFDSRLYLCLGIFGFITKDVFERLTFNLVLPFYIPSHFIMFCALVYTVFNRWRNGKRATTPKDPRAGGDCHANSFTGGLSHRPELAFHVVQAVFFGVLALFTLRMKYFWTPYICMLAAVGISDASLWGTLLHYLRIRHKHAVTIARSSAVVIVLGALIQMVLPGISKEMENLTEFWDPDTVELMEWIITKTAPTAAFTGSMQLLAGVKLCTGRRITNHPHYEDKYLRQKTKQLYQIYGRREPEDVHKILTQYGSNYIILEDSICRAPSRGGCRLPDLIDIDNGVMPDEPSGLVGLVESRTLRFCEAVRLQKKPYANYFKTVFVNKTFRLYKVL